jgi:HopA1 effector protein family
VVADLSESGAVLTGGYDGALPPGESIVSQRPAAGATPGDPAAGPWPPWARSQLERAVTVAESAADGMSAAALLYREWFNPAVGDVSELVALRPLAGVYRAAHAGSRTRVRSGDLSVVTRNDVVRASGWWRTWGEDWTPPRARRGSVRLFLTPRPDRLADFVAIVTGRLLHERDPWSLALATDPRRIGRYGCAVLDLSSLAAVTRELVDDLELLLRPVAPPLCLPVADGIGAAEYPDNGMTFGEHRCHLVALALRHPSSARDPLRAIAAVFNAHGIDPSSPHRAN